MRGVACRANKVTDSANACHLTRCLSRREASRGKQAMQNFKLGSRVIRIGWAQKNTNLFVGDLDCSVTNDMMRRAFGAFGPLVIEDTFKKGERFGFVRFRSRKHAEQAKDAMDGFVLGKRPIRVGWGHATVQRNSVHVRFDAALAERLKLVESDLEQAFQACGAIESIQLPRTGGKLHGYAFVHFVDYDGCDQNAGTVLSC